MPEPSPECRPDRRALLTGTAVLLTGCAAPGSRQPTGGPDETGPARAPAAARGAAYRFRGRRQAGITDPQQRYVRILAFDLAPGRRGTAGARGLRDVLTAWTRAIATATATPATATPATATSAGAPGPRPGRLTATVAIGPRLPGLLGLRTPALLAELPLFPGDRLRQEESGGDLLVQVCGDRSGDVTETARTLVRLADGTLRARWAQSGYLPAHSGGETPRNLFGFKDGTINPTPAEAERWVWVGQGPDRDGSYLVVRRIHMDTGAFTALPPHRQEAVIGRTRAVGAPLGHQHEHQEVDLFAKTPEGRYVLPVDAHVRQAHSRLDHGARMLRRGYSYDNGPQDRGLLFLAYLNDPHLFVRVQERLAVKDALSRFVEHRASALAYVLPGTGPTGNLGDPLFA